VATLTNSLPEISWKTSWPILLGLCAVYLPTIYTFSKYVWLNEDHAHAPIILLAVAYIFWQKRGSLMEDTNERSRPIAGWMLLLFGLLLYLFGRTETMRLFEIGSLVPVLLGILLITRGMSTVRTFWFPLLFLLMVIPLPAAVIDILTGPLKRNISELAESVLYWAGYPIARSGVMLSIGQYQLLVADACSGLNSMFSLSSMGLLYLYLMHYTSWIRNGVMIASLLPIAFFANLLRVIILVLVTYHFGNDAGQGFLHKFAGFLLFFVSMFSLFALDAFLGWILPNITKTESK
jgi:exosortase B